jgi:hypothetical protein
MQPILKKKKSKEKEFCEPVREKKDKPFIIESKYKKQWRWSKRDNEWHSHSSYRTERDRKKALKQLQKTKASFYDVRIKPNN